MGTVTLTINGKQIIANEGLSVLEAAKQHNILIPHFCYLEGVHQVGACRICVVEIEGSITTVPPGAELYLDGTKCGTSPMTIRVPDIPDVGKTVQLEIRIAGCNTVTETVSLVQGQQNALSFELILLSPTLQINWEGKITLHS